MLRAERITHRIDGHTILSDVSGSFAAGELSLIIGPNGAGKSTLVRAITRQLVPSEGHVSYDGRPLREWSDMELARVRAVLSQTLDVAFPITAWEVVMVGRFPHFTGTPEPSDEKACEDAMRFFGVLDLADRNYLTLSGGERQRVQFARVLTQIWYPVDRAHRYLVLDEPLTFLDIRHQFELMRKLRDLMERERIVVIGVVHDLNLAARFADHMVLLSGGRVLASGKPETVLTPVLIGEAFGITPVVYRVPGSERSYLFFD
jgi:iron complex transport system ATP-binding protein